MFCVASRLGFTNSYVKSELDDGINNQSEVENGKRVEEGDMEDGDGFSPEKGDDSQNDMDRDHEARNMVEYEELEADIVKWCKENNSLWEDKDFSAGPTSLYNVNCASWIFLSPFDRIWRTCRMSLENLRT